MAWVNLAANQMADEANAVTAGFTAIGTKLSPTNKCYAKSEALAAYSLVASAMAAYANNQLVPKSVWQTVTPTSPTSILASNVWIFNKTAASFAAVKAATSADTIVNSGTKNVGNAEITAGSSYDTGRLVVIFDTSAVTTTPTFGTMSFYITSNTVGTSLTFNIVTPNVTFTPAQVLTVADWDSWNGASDGTGISNSTRTINAGQTGKLTFALPPFLLNDINANNQFDVYIISNGDIDNVPPTTNNRPLFSSEKGLGLSGVGDYELLLSY